MGWTYQHVYNKQVKDIIRQEFMPHEIMAISGGGIGRPVYAAIKSAKDGLVEAIVCDVKWVSNSYYNFGYKDMSEFTYPYFNSAPRKVLGALSPLSAFYSIMSDDSIAWARKWREECWSKVLRNEAFPRLKEGDVLTFIAEIGYRSKIITEATITHFENKKAIMDRYYMLPNDYKDITRTITREGVCIYDIEKVAQNETEMVSKLVW